MLAPGMKLDLINYRFRFFEGKEVLETTALNQLNILTLFKMSDVQVRYSNVLSLAEFLQLRCYQLMHG